MDRRVQLKEIGCVLHTVLVGRQALWSGFAFSFLSADLLRFNLAFGRLDGQRLRLIPVLSLLLKGELVDEVYLSRLSFLVMNRLFADFLRQQPHANDALGKSFIISGVEADLVDSLGRAEA